ncbi:MAG: DUF2075 domain-containing protein [Bacteroidetes bacterium]|nr:DUF2075 domain-containing protein [Bacteroidota bacterium]
MIVYQKTKKGFEDDIISGDIENIILKLYETKLHRSTGKKEQDSWRNSLHYMNTVLSDPEIPYNTGVTIELQIPQTSKRIDFIISGKNENSKDHVVIVELKQWQASELTEKDGIVKTALGKGLHESNHPSYQAWSYAALLQDFNTTIQNENIQLHPCAYLHNYIEDDVIRNPFYQKYLDEAPVFLKKDIAKLREFIKAFVKTGDDGDIMYRIDKGEIRPSKMLSESLAKMIAGNQEFIMIDEQKIVYENAMALAKESTAKNKNVLIVEGGPGTGKSVVAINLLVGITNLSKVVQYVSKNAAPRAVYASKLTKTLTKTKFSNLFKGSGAFTDTAKNTFDTLVVDEAHRLNEKSGLYSNLGENQVKEIISASKFSVFFIDEDQRVTMKDIGNKEEIKKWAKSEGAIVHELELSSQFRCAGSDGYLAWLDQMLQIRETANTDIKELGYDFKVVSSPNELRDIIFEKNKANNKARLVAGYCWDWKSKNDKNANDIIIPEYNFAMKWNLSVDGSLCIQMPNSVYEIGCIHTCQGLEVDYIGVIVGKDLIVRDGKVLVDPSKRSKQDQSIKGYKSMLLKEPEKAKEMTRSIIKNTYRTLMTRGMKGCYVYFEDKETEEWFGS